MTAPTSTHADSLAPSGKQTLTLTGLRFDASLGILEHEKNAPQPIQVDAELNLGPQPLLPRDDDISNVLDYRKVRKIIIDECTAEQVNLLESLIGKLSHRLLQLHEAVREFANEAFKQIDVNCCAFIDDDFAHLAVVKYVADIVVTGQQRLRAEVEFGVYLNRLWRGFFVFQNAQVGIKAQACQREGLIARGGCLI